MDYDPIKDRLGAAFTRSPLLHRAFFRALDAVFLRAWWVHREVRRIVEALPRDRSVRVLDAGTGFGQYAYFLLRSYPHVEVTAVDVKADYLDAARQFFDRTPFGGRIAFREHDLTEPLPEVDRFDLALSVDVMEHIEDDRAVFRTFHRALRPGGSVVVNTPSDRGGSGITEAGEESFIGEHVREGYAPAELRAKLEAAGLEVERWAYTYGRYGSAGWHLLVKWPILALNRSMALGALLPLYYLPALPAGLALNALDVRTDNAEGTGLLMTARKPPAL
ncbi:MAG: class I SAM-dependent methyltransferase [Rhodothermales bacterium]|nr:class I SAM-dependent methyltransferase [Rhodothermales bacterium]